MLANLKRIVTLFLASISLTVFCHAQLVDVPSPTATANGFQGFSDNTTYFKVLTRYTAYYGNSQGPALIYTWDPATGKTSFQTDPADASYDTIVCGGAIAIVSNTEMTATGTCCPWCTVNGDQDKFVLSEPLPQKPKVDGVEPTQVIQQYQTIDALQSSGATPVPLVSGKPAVLRFYFQPLKSVSQATIQLISPVAQTQTITVPPNCKPAVQRARLAGCQSMDFYFTPNGPWTLQYTQLDSDGNKFPGPTINLNSQKTVPLNLTSAGICDTQIAHGNSTSPWLCSNATDFIPLISTVTKLIPASSFSMAVSDLQLYSDISDCFDSAADSAAQNACFMPWASDLLFQLGWYAFDNPGGSGHTNYVGMYRGDYGALGPNVFGGYGGLAPTPGDAQLNRAHYYADINPGPPRAYGGADLADPAVAHETGHTLGLHHTTNANPGRVAGTGCWGVGIHPGDWPFPDNDIQSANATEIGFDMTTESPVFGFNNYDIMGYCSPSWIAPGHYTELVNALSPGGSADRLARKPMVEGRANSTPLVRSIQPFWIVSGSVGGSGAVLDPLFQTTLNGDTSTGAGAYAIVVEDSSGTALFTRNFDVSQAIAETPDPDNEPSTEVSYFIQAIPVVSGASRIVVQDPAGAQIGNVTLGGTPPVVTVTSPAAGSTQSGQQTVQWTVQSGGMTHTDFAAKLAYSTDNGVTFHPLTAVRAGAGTSTPINFDLLGGSTNAVIQVMVSDGANTGIGLSPSFIVAKKKPSIAVINWPKNNYSQPAANPLLMNGIVYDTDDGILSGSAVQWTSDLQGNLGSGSSLSVQLQPGTHHITLTGTDSDGNSLTATTTVIMGGAPPALNLQLNGLNGDSSFATCVNATIGAAPGTLGAPLSSVDYSLDGGLTYTTVPLNSLPFVFQVPNPGNGSLYVVARAFDISGQSAAQDASLAVPAACPISSAQTQSINFGALNNVTFGASPITLTATATSGLPVGYSVTGPASLSGSTLTITGAGTVSVTATQAGDSTFAAAASVTQSFSVAPATPTVTWTNPPAITYGMPLGTVLNAVAQLNGNAVPGSISYSATVTGGTAAAVTATTYLMPGTYSIGAVFTPADTTNYTTANGAVPLVVNRASPSLILTTASSAVLVQTAATVTATFSSSLAPPSGTVQFLDSGTVLATVPISNGVASFSSTSLAVGSHAISAVYSGDANYAPYVTSSLQELVEDFSVSANGGNSQWTFQGQTASFTLSIAPVGGAKLVAPVSLAVTGLPAGASATFSPAGLSTGSQASAVTLAIQPPTQAYNRLSALKNGIALCFLAPFLLGVGKQRRTAKLKKVVSLILLAGGLFAASSLTGCVSSKQPVTSNFTVTATSGPVVHSLQLTLTVE